MGDIPIQLGRKRHCLALGLGMAAIMVRGLGIWRLGIRGKRSVLILEPFGLGDVLALEPLVRLLKKDAWAIHICAKSHWKPILPPGNVDTWIDERIPWTSYNDGDKYRLAAFRAPAWRSFIRELKSAGAGNVGIDCRGDIRNVLLLYGAGCRTVLTLSHYIGSDLRMMPGAARMEPVDPSLKRWELNLAFAKALGVNMTSPIPPPNATHLLPGKSAADSSTVGLVPVAPWQGRLWPAVKWKELVDKLNHRGKKTVGIHGPGQSHLAREMLGADTLLVEAACPSDWALHLAKMEQVVTLDSGPLHLADALGVRVVGLYGPGKLPLWAPSGRQSRAVHHQNRPGFYPCHQVNANIGLGLRYMDWIQVDEVLAAVLEWKESAQ